MPFLLLQRLASLALTLAVASLLVFAVLELLPGNAAAYDRVLPAAADAGRAAGLASS